MCDDQTGGVEHGSGASGNESDAVEAKPLTPAAKRALAEAEARRSAAEEAQEQAARAKEVGGRDGPDPVRFGDWEKGGICSDF